MRFRIGFVACIAGTAVVMAGNRMAVGTPASILASLEAENSAATRALSLPIGPGGRIRLQAEDWYSAGGEISLAGRAAEATGSDFILKGDARALYGWIVLRDRHTAFEYTTDPSGVVAVEEVPVERIYPDCGDPTHAQEAREGPASAAAESPYSLVAGPEPHIGPYAGQDLYKLQSLPGAGKVLWLDISRVMDGDTPLHMSKEEMYKTWQIHASSFSMFDVNVTTDKAVYDSAGLTRSGINRFVNVSGRSFCPINAFGTTRYCQTQLQASPMTHFMYGKTAAHETGHLMGLSHDGSASTDYYNGFSTYQWAPIMGNNLCCRTWSEAAIQWSKGEYTGSNNRQDDLSIISRSLSFKEDDISAPVPLKVDKDSVSPLMNRGQVNDAEDRDPFTFQVGPAGARLDLLVDRTELRGGSALDIDARILDSAGKMVSQSNVTKVRSARFANVTLPPGKYSLVISGGAEGTPLSGFSNYGSMGFYAIGGRITGLNPTGTPGADLAGAASKVVSPRHRDGRLHLGLPPEAKIGGIVLHSAAGAVVFRSVGRIESIDLARVPSGVYLLSVALDGAVARKKVVKD